MTAQDEAIEREIERRVAQLDVEVAERDLAAAESRVRAAEDDAHDAMARLIRAQTKLRELAR
jgi:hypothetical protein